MNTNINNVANKNNKNNNNEIRTPGVASVKVEGVMNTGNNNMKIKNALLVAAAAVTGLTAVPQASKAALYTLTSNNSVVQLNPFADPSQANGLYNWTVDNVSQTGGQGFYYSINNGATNQLANLTPSVLVPPVQTVGTSFIQLSYQGQGFTVQTRYNLTGGPAGGNFSDLQETVIVQNIGSSAVNFRGVDYTDLDLGGQSAGQTATTLNNGVIFTQSSANNWNGKATSSAAVSPATFEYEASAVPTLLNALNGGAGIPLNDNPTVTNTDASYAVEYDQTLTAGRSLIFTVDQQIQGPGVPIPEPKSGAALVAASGLVLMRPRRRDNDADPRMAHVAGA